MTDAHGPAIHTGASVGGIMVRVCLALVPGLVCSIVFFGWGVLFQCLLAVALALAAESVVLRLRGRPVRRFLADGSVTVTALLFALTITPLAPWWVTLAGIAFAVVFAKHLFGGLGHNPFNPAMAGYAFVLLCFPVAMNAWPALPADSFMAIDAGTCLKRIFLPGRVDIDAFTGATPLAYLQSQLTAMHMIPEIRTASLFGNLGGRGWEWINLGFLLGGLGLVFLRTIYWQIPLVMLAALFIISGVFNAYDADVYASPLFHLFSGGTMLGAFFIATDPVTASGTPRGRIIYAALIGVLTWFIRTFGAYPDGIAFAVLTANALVPAIDHFTRPRVLGEGPP